MDQFKLTPTEKKILKLICNGYTTREISFKIFSSIPTIETHRGNIYDKLEARNVADVVRIAIKNKLVEI